MSTTIRKRALFFCLALALFGAAPAGEFSRKVGEGMILVNVFPGLTLTSTPISITVKNGNIPDGAVVESVSVETGKITDGPRPRAMNVISSYNLQGPGMAAPARKKWAGKGRDTGYRAAELGPEPVPVKGLWRLSMTGNNVGTVPATTSHQIKSLTFRYRTP